MISILFKIFTFKLAHLKYNEHDRCKQIREQIIVIELEYEWFIPLKVYSNFNAVRQADNSEEKQLD